MIEIRTSYLVIGFILMPFMWGRGEIADSIQQRVDVREERQEKRQQINAMVREADFRRELSQLAIARVKGRCIPVVSYDENRQPTPLSEGTRIVHDDTGEPMADGNACNQLGDTCEIVDGTCQNVAGVKPDDLDEYMSYFEVQR